MSLEGDLSFGAQSSEAPLKRKRAGSPSEVPMVKKVYLLQAPAVAFQD
jgi:hypothetical protein